MRDYKEEYEGRVAYIRDLVKNSGVSGIVFGNSGGKDSALVGILCKAACDNTLGVIMPCASKRNYGQDADDGRALAEQFGIESRTVDLTAVRAAEMAELEKVKLHRKELDDKTRSLEEKIRECKRQEIIGMVESANLSPQQLSVVIENAKKGILGVVPGKENSKSEE